MPILKKTLAITFLSLCSSALLAQTTFVPLRINECPGGGVSDCITTPTNLFTTGEQYLMKDGFTLDPANGVLPDSWSMLTRWQGSSMNNPVTYNLGAFTGLNVPPPTSYYQRGFAPESAAGTPGSQIYRDTAGMLINTWSIPHRFVQGGSYNNMYGYAWSPSQWPAIFADGNHLMLQTEASVPFVSSWNNGAFEGDSRANARGQLAFFAYIADITNPGSPPIALISLIYENGFATAPENLATMARCSNPAYVMQNSDVSVSRDYKFGVWFSNKTVCRESGFYTGEIVKSAPFDSGFFRVEFTREYVSQVIAKIRARDTGFPCTQHPEKICPVNYSTNLGDYRLQYAGLISELTLIDGGIVMNESIAKNASMAARVKNTGIYLSK